jgi:hypothetical protein
MIPSWLISLILVCVVIPLVGVVFYAWLCRTMTKRDIPEPPYITYFFLFVHAGIWFLLFFTAFLWGWSGMSSIGLFYLMFISPFPAGAFAFVLHGVRKDSAFHRWAFRISAGYAVIIAVLFAAWITYCYVTRC